MSRSLTYFILAPSSTLAANRIARIIVHEVPGSACHICTSMGAVINDLQGVARQYCTAILLASDHGELDQILGLAGFFDGLPLILMVPDDSADTIAKAHRLRPRYLMLSQIDFRELRAVIKKKGMTANLEKSQSAMAAKTAPGARYNPPGPAIPMKGKCNG